MLALQQTIMRASANLRCKGAAAKLDFIWILNTLPFRGLHCANMQRKPEAKHCSSLCLQSEGDEYCGGQARAKNPTKSWPRALAMFATCSWPSLCEQSELQCWRRNRRLCGPAQFSAARTLPPNLIVSTRVRDNILKSKEQKNIQPTKGGHKMVTCQNYVSLFYCQITSCPSDGGIS